MRPAFLISTHTQPQLLARIVEHLSAVGDVHVHVDARVDIAPFQRAVGESRVHWLESRIPVYWGSASIVDAYLMLAREALRGTPDCCVALSGQCYPVRPLSELVEHLRAEPRAHMTLRPFPSPSTGKPMTRFTDRVSIGMWTQRPNNPFVKIANRALNTLLPRRDVSDILAAAAPTGLWTGLNFWAFGQQTMRDILSDIECNTALSSGLKRARNAVETYMHTFAARSVSPSDMKPHLHYMEWARPKTGRVFQFASAHPTTLTERDFDAIVDSRKFFARKVGLPASEGLLDQIDRTL